jgi:UDP-glucose 4-epimerase
MKSIVTGGAGFIGSHLVEKLDNLGHDVVVLDDFSTGEPENLPKKHMDKARIVDIIDCDLISECEGADYIFHMAARPNVQGSIDHPEVSAYDSLATLKILNVARKLKVKRVIFSSSCSIYGDAEEIPTTEEESKKPKSPYALSKYQGEQYCKLFSELYGLDSVCLRYFNVYGDRMTSTGAYRSVLSVFLEAKQNGKPLNVVNDGEQRRDFVHVSDVVEANIKSMALDCWGDSTSVNIGCGKNYSVNEIADMIGGEKVYGEKRIEPKQTLALIEEAKRILNWEPKVKLEDWLNEF